MKTKRKISGYVIRSGAYAVFLPCTLIALSSAFNSPNRWHKSSGATDAYDVTAKVASQPRVLSFAERVAFQHAIEEVYWRHRIWPKENPDPKPLLNAVISQAQLENKVENYLRDSLVLEEYWQKPIAAEQLQAEMDRMARDTKQPEVLRELFEALGNDPAAIAECLARPILAEHLIADFPAQDETRRGESSRTGGLRTMSTATRLGQFAYTLPKIADAADPPCTDDTWTATTTANAPVARLYHTAVWTGSEMIVWGGASSLSPATYFNTGGRYNPSTDSWTVTSTTNAPTARAYHTVVWTGSEMMVWGGFDGTQTLNTGGRYNPSTNSWTATSTTNAPTARDVHTAVWTGSEMIIWGGAHDNFTALNTGGRYNPITNSWIATSTTNAPTARSGHTAVWTGSQMIIWGSPGGDNSGGRYTPSTDSWTATSTANAPSPRYLHTAVWTGSEMIVWGGLGVFPPPVNTGGRYNPITNSWTATSTSDAPTARLIHTAVWTGSEMIIWGGIDGGNSGGKYNPSTNSWIATSTTNAPTGRYYHTAVWIGSEMIVWGGVDVNQHVSLNTGGWYCAQGGPSPTPTSTPTPTASPTPTPTPTPCTGRCAPTPRPRPTPAPRLMP
jgi:N-acetylneuraminic acid mutarotase